MWLFGSGGLVHLNWGHGNGRLGSSVFVPIMANKMCGGKVPSADQMTEMRAVK